MLSSGGLIADISNGLEQVPVSLEYTSQKQLDELRAVHTRYVVHSVIPGQEDDQECYYDGCECTAEDDEICRDGNECGCIGTHGTHYTPTDPPLLVLLLFPPSTATLSPIYECNSRCTCPTSCLNRVVQHGCRVPLRVFHTGTARGWGIRAGRAIAKGEFVCEYAGEVVRGEEVRRRRWGGGEGRGNYVLCVREHVGNGDRVLRTNIDPTTTANLARFINHSCSPNLALFPVRMDSLVPAVGMFALRDIVEDEELGFDYAGMLGYGEGAQGWEEREHTGRTRCLCGAGEGICRRWLPFDEEL